MICNATDGALNGSTKSFTRNELDIAIEYEKCTQPVITVIAKSSTIVHKDCNDLQKTVIGVAVNGCN